MEITNVNFEDDLIHQHLEDSTHQNYEYLQSFMEILAVCHTIIVDQKKGKTVYNSSSPDELALVNASKFFGFNFKGRDEENNMIVDNNGYETRFRLLNLIEFTSARKRMTVIVRTEDGKIKVMCKGADSIITPRLKPNQRILEQTMQYLDQYAKEGLRTLLLAQKEVSEEFYDQWNYDF